MNSVYVINASDYRPISLGDAYLYQQYDRIASFLGTNYGQEYVRLLAKPVIINNQINWHTDYDQPLSRIGDLSPEIQNKIKTEYWKAKNKLDKDIEELEYSRAPEKQNWGNILKQIFNDENNVILTDGNYWCLLWGWKFMNKKENYLPPVFEKTETEIEEVPSEDVNPVPVQEPDIEEEIIEPEPIPTNNVINAVKPRKKSFWYGIKRGLRNFVYRYWGLLFFILFCLLMFCLMQHCSREECPEIYELNNQLDSLNSEINARCIEV